jgi:uncharacterized membrane protein YphA (DoxX/SURF4 family)
MKKSFSTHFPDTVIGLFIALFMYTAVSKILNYQSFYATMDIMPALKGRAFMFAPAVIISEIIISVLLIIPVLKLWGLFLSLALMFVFTVYLMFAVAKGYVLPCSCGGVLRQLSWKQHVLFNIVFIILAMAGILSFLKQKHLLQ